MNPLFPIGAAFSAYLAFYETKKSSSLLKKTRVIIPIENKRLGTIEQKVDFNKLLLELPKTEKQFYSEIAQKANASKIKSIIQTNFAHLKQAENLTRVPAYILAPIIFAESGGNPKAVSSANAYGLMQFKAQSANDIIILENNKQRLSDAEKAIIRKYIGNRLDNILRMKYLSHKAPGNNEQINFITQEDLFNPEFAILIGAMKMGLLIDEHIERGNKLILEKSMLRYGRGYFYKPKGDNFEQVLESVKNNKENYNALLKYFGINGLFQTALNVVKTL